MYLNSFIVFFCKGLWHAAAWKFIFWGLFHGVFLIIEKIGFGELLKSTPKICKHIYTIIIVMIGWVFFRVEGFFNALKYIKRLFIFNVDKLEYFYLTLDIWKIFIAICAILLSFPIINITKEKIIIKKVGENIKYEILVDFIYFLLFIISICFISASNFNPFIYFRF